MQKKYLVLCLASALPMGFTASALAQTQSSTQAPTLAAPPVTSPYQLSGASISGSGTASSTIMTTPVGSAAAYKTEGGLYVYPTAGLYFGRNDNLLTTNSYTIASNFVNFTPQVVGEYKNKGDRYTAMARMDAYRYASSERDNVTNSEWNVAGDNYFGSRARVGWKLDRLNGSDARGSTQRRLEGSPDLYHTQSMAATAIYGAPEASGRLEADAGRLLKHYDNNRDVTTALDQSINNFAGRGFFRLGGRTMALAEYRQAVASYNAAAADSNTERRYYLGLTWEATAATTGIIKLGRMTKDFSIDTGKSSFSGGSWEGTVRWVPLTYSAFDLSTSRYTADPTGFGEYKLNTDNNLLWSHKWTQSLNSRAYIGQLATDFVGTERSDKTRNFGLAVDYSVLRWLKVGADFTRTDNTSTLAPAAYTRNITMLTLNASL